MAQPTCTKCGGTQFQIVTKDLRDAMVCLVQCSKCGGVVGAFPALVAKPKAPRWKG